ncbi:MAG: hypothetical protein CL933_24940 [Deltaproteobacteria bacterium]|nr:hypothetical protein [Deltaproteobacteria bacterium]
MLGIVSTCAYLVAHWPGFYRDEAIGEPFRAPSLMIFVRKRGSADRATNLALRSGLHQEDEK